MNILLIGGGGREHALAWKIAQSPLVQSIRVVPGNPGIAELPKCKCVSLNLNDLNEIADYAEEQSIDLTVVGPEATLVAGIADVFRSRKVCTDIDSAKAFVEEQGAPIVVKADGLAAGKGVVVAMTKAEAMAAIDDMMADHKFGEAGARVVLEEFMEGEEASLLAFTDGKIVVPMVASQDHKRVNDGDKGPNTGGMGAYAPAPVMTEALRIKAEETILKPVIAALNKEGRTYCGCLYAGLMIKGDSVKVVEFNCRFGDPETQVVLPLLDSDLVQIMLACATGTLDASMVKWKNQATVCVVMASGGYPGSYENGKVITGLKEAGALENVVVFHAGTKEKDGKVVTAGGRVLGVTALAKDIKSAKNAAYGAVEKIRFEKAHYRKDIAWRALFRK